ncbi:MAG TPA: helix-turn-helix transcriptional regulator [Verrucomicrobiae bacterium]|nr:helix-turn-helix transcriptional regulator [Verrucomicrobiae bacterium]
MKNIPQPHQQITKNVIGPRVRQARLRSRPRFTQQQLADRVAKLGANIDSADIDKIETGRRRVKDFELLALAKALNVPVKRLLPARRGHRNLSLGVRPRSSLSSPRL